ncbi:MAG: hypothetical protein QHH13_00895 [Melioribacter sp.]|uniref:hypothetical protein n=1 Tax=Rosettibacter primus TaxID=3111523 RepID=UPI00247D442D|nr:hypothetical protein [Melioribacter sp.]
MITFVKFHLRQLISFSQLIVFALYVGFAWFLASPFFAPNIIYSSEKIIRTYNFMLFSVGLLNYILNIVSHFPNEFHPAKYQITASRLSSVEFFKGLIIVYIIYFTIMFVLPTYFIAFIQQAIYAPKKIDLFYYMINCFVGIFGNVIIWTIISIIIIVKTGNEFRTLLLIGLFYGLSLLINNFSNGVLFNNTWFVSVITEYKNFENGIAWFISVCIFTVWGHNFSKKLNEKNFVVKYPKGFYALLLQKLNAKMSSYHVRMIGLENQKIITFFVVLGTLLLLPFLKKEGVNLLPMVQIYLGGFIALFFSFNQYFLMKIDEDAGMIHNNYLRAYSYSSIILNRWFITLIPHIMVVLICMIIIHVWGSPIDTGKIFYIILLNIFCSLLNLFFAIVLRINAAANLLLLLIVYGQLLDDFQRFIKNYPTLQSINIFSPLLTEQKIPSILWLFLLCNIVVIFILIVVRLKKIHYEYFVMG